MIKAFLVRGWDYDASQTDRAYTDRADAEARKTHLYNWCTEVPLMDHYVVDGSLGPYREALEYFCKLHDYPIEMANKDISTFFIDEIEVHGETK